MKKNRDDKFSFNLKGIKMLDTPKKTVRKAKKKAR